MATQTTQGSGIENIAGGSVLHGGDVSSTRFRNLSARNNSFKYYNWGLPHTGQFGGMQATQLGGAVAITAITQSGSTGYVNIEKSTHGLAVNDRIVVYSADVAGYNTVHRVTVVTDANNVQTDVLYSAATSSAHGSYKLFSGNFNTITAGSYIAQIIGKNTGGSSISALRITGADVAPKRPLATATGNNRYHITSWNHLTGAPTKGANAGDTLQYIKPQGGAALTEEPKPTRAAPGRVVFGIGTQIPTRDTYNAST